MHIFGYFRGKHDRCELLKQMMQFQFWQFSRKRFVDGEYKDEDLIIQGVLRQSYAGMYEYIIPHECLPEALAMLQALDDQWGHKGTQLRAAPIRMAYGLKRIPEHIFQEAKKISPSISLTGSRRALASCTVEGAGFAVVGMKEDKFGEIDFGEKGKFIQEFL